MFRISNMLPDIFAVSNLCVKSRLEKLRVMLHKFDLLLRLGQSEKII